MAGWQWLAARLATRGTQAGHTGRQGEVSREHGTQAATHLSACLGCPLEEQAGRQDGEALSIA